MKSELIFEDKLPSEKEVLEEIYNFVKTNFNDFRVKKTDWFSPRWSPFIIYCFYKWGEKKGFTINLKRSPQFCEFYRNMEGSEKENEMYQDKSLKEYLTIDLSWRPSNANIPINLTSPILHPNSPILYLALEHEEDLEPKYIVNHTFVGAQIDEVRKLGCIRSFIKILFTRPRYEGEDGKSKGYIELEKTLKAEIEKELNNLYIEAYEKWILIMVTLDNTNKATKMIFHGYKYNQDEERLESFDEDKYSIKIDNSSDYCKILNEK